jgi:hypothetical protein
VGLMVVLTTHQSARADGVSYSDRQYQHKHLHNQAVALGFDLSVRPPSTPPIEDVSDEFWLIRAWRLEVCS